MTRTAKPADAPKSWDRRPEGRDRAAAAYQKGIRPMMDPYAAELIQFANVRAGLRVLDVATGPGTVAFQAVNAVGLTGHVTAVDFSPRMIELLEGEIQRRGLSKRIDARVGDGQTLAGFPDSTFDRVLSQFGVTFFPDPLGGLRAAHRTLKPGGVFTASCWGPMERNPFLTVFLRSVQQHVPPKPDAPRPAVFALSQKGEFEALLEQAGFHDVDGRTVRHPWGSPTAQAYWDLILEGSPAVSGFMETTPPDLREKIQETLLGTLRNEFGDGPVRFQAEARILRGTK